MGRAFFNRPLGTQLRFAEKTLLAFFATVVVVSLTLSLPGRTLAVLAALNVMAGAS